MTTNPYAAPKAAVADDTVINNADFVPGGQSLPAGRGWEWIAAAWGLFKRQPGLWIGTGLLLAVVLFGLAVIPFLGAVLPTLLWPVFAAGVAIGCRALDEGGELEIGHLFAGFRERVGTLIGIGALSLAATLVVVLAVGLVLGAGMFAMMSGGGDPEVVAAAGGATMLLAVLIMIALLLPVTMAMWFAPPLVVFHELGAIEAMKVSFVGCLKNIVPFLVYGVVMFALMLLATLPLLLGWLALWPVIVASVYTAYRDIYFKPRA